MYFAHCLWLLYAAMYGSQILKYLLADSQQKKFADPIAVTLEDSPVENASNITSFFRLIWLYFNPGPYSATPMVEPAYQTPLKQTHRGLVEIAFQGIKTRSEDE